jgi:hypothetical protein
MYVFVFLLTLIRIYYTYIAFSLYIQPCGIARVCIVYVRTYTLCTQHFFFTYSGIKVAYIVYMLNSVVCLVIWLTHTRMTVEDTYTSFCFASRRNTTQELYWHDSPSSNEWRLRILTVHFAVCSLAQKNRSKNCIGMTPRFRFAHIKDIPIRTHINIM